MLTYKNELIRAMNYLGSMSDTVFLGQAVEYPGTALSGTLEGVSKLQKLEMPVAEEMQMGISIGLALSGVVPVTLFPRWNFLLLAMNQLVNNLDKFPLMSDYSPKVIIRTAIGSERPLNPSLQHTGDFTVPVQLMLDKVEVVRLDESKEIFPAYERAYTRTDGVSTILVEWGDYYNEK